MRKLVYSLLEDPTVDTRAARIVGVSLSTLIVFNIGAVILSTVPSLGHLAWLFNGIEWVSVAVFSTEYLLRVWVVAERLERPVVGRLKFMAGPMMMIDLVAILPSVVPGLVFDLRYIRAFRLMRLLKLGRHSRALRLLVGVFRAKREELLATFSVASILLIVVSSAMYFAEHPAQPDKFSSIPATMWWAVATLTTVGYGDIVPITAIGKLLGAFAAIIGVGLFALPAAILGSGLVEAFEEDREKRRDRLPADSDPSDDEPELAGV